MQYRTKEAKEEKEEEVKVKPEKKEKKKLTPEEIEAKKKEALERKKLKD